MGYYLIKYKVLIEYAAYRGAGYINDFYLTQAYNKENKE